MQILAWLHAYGATTGLQLLLDFALLALVLIMLKKQERHRFALAQEDLVCSFEKIIAETKQLGTLFDANLQERQQQIQQILAELDRRLEQAQKASQQMSMPSSPEAIKPYLQHEEVMHLFQRGCDTELIAKKLNKPLGEVELILKLQQLDAH